ncbi:hypothetical protein C3K47_15595 [Solitalea longa]|uniref:Uncharacterized protein n=1 Tax=Solitalea longa TaxID=2079460 RepID=A0A2S4ZZT2_9SPHI|nr:hypothetical protein [Solitalea longa]POY35482.1 hypothetical protein C3K47_15595 [Solitalea longa]
MSKKKSINQTKKFKFQQYQEIGSPDAETDNLLLNAFIENDALKALIDMNNQRSIVIGRTGSGKSAILRYIENSQEKVIRIEPEAMSLRFLSNSTILNYFRAIDVNLNFFYKILWKHVFVIELLKLYFRDDQQKKQNWFNNIIEKLNGKKGNAKREKAIKYLETCSNDFWLDTEKRIKEIESSVQKKFTDEIGVDLKSLVFKSNANNSSEDKTVSEIKNKAEHVISEVLAEEIHDIINILRDEIFVDSQRKHFIIVDDLDKEWVPTNIRYDMIGAMIEVIKEFQVFKGAKIIISLRDNLYQLIFAGFKHNGGQREKFKPLYVELQWTSEELNLLLEKRLDIISENTLSVKEAFEKIYNKHAKGLTGFEYMLERTFYRPRDVISYVNHTIENSNNKSHFTLDIIKKAEISYSVDRLQAIEDEWGENYGNIREIYKFLEAKYNGFNVRNIKEDEFINIYFSEELEKKFRGDLLLIIQKWKSDETKFNSFLKELLFLLYLIGIIGIKKGPTAPVQFFFDKTYALTKNEISNDSKIYVHKAFYSALRINTKELE